MNASSVGLKANLSDDSLYATRNIKSSGANYTQVLWTPPLPGNKRHPSYWFVGGMSGWMASLGFATWSFAGIESLTLMTTMVKDPLESVPFGCLWGCVLLFCTCIFIVFVCGAMPPGLFATAGIETFMSTGYQLMWPDMSFVTTIGTQAVTQCPDYRPSTPLTPSTPPTSLFVFSLTPVALILPGLIGMGWGFIVPTGTNTDPILAHFAS